nr:LOW QUALITY PROTEIN: protein kish-B [Chlorocebus sabaeus]
MTNMYSLDGIPVFGLLFVCTCAYFKKVPASSKETWLLSEKKGVLGIFGPAAVIGTRLHAAVAIACVMAMAFYVLFIKMNSSIQSSAQPRGQGIRTC